MQKNVQEWIEKAYPYRKEKKSRVLNGSKKKLTGSLIVTDWPNLEEINAYDNQLTSVQISGCPQLTEIYLWNNQMTDLFIRDCPEISYLRINGNSLNSLDFLATLPYKEKLIWLNLSDNNFPPQDLSFLKEFIGLERLWLDSNPFFGSLEPLKKLVSLKELYLSDTAINFGLEYLPESLETISCNNNEFQIQLKDYQLSGDEYDYQAWRQINQEKVNEILELENSLTNIQLAANIQNLNQKVDKSLQAFTFQTEEKIKELKKELYRENELENRIEQLQLNKS